MSPKGSIGYVLNMMHYISFLTFPGFQNIMSTQLDALLQKVYYHFLI